MKRFPWPEFLWLLAVATLIHFHLHYWILFIAACWGWCRLCKRYPTLGYFTLAFLDGFIRGLPGTGRRRRW